MEKKLKVGILGATGMVGQRFIALLENHPWFQVVTVAASPRSAGRTYEEAVGDRWKMTTPMPEAVKRLVVMNVNEVEKVAAGVDFVFSAVDMTKDEIKAIEEAYAKTETPVVSNNSAHRWTPDVPMVVPEINPEHFDVIPFQKKRLGTERGFIAVKPNCSIQSYAPVLTAWKEFEPYEVVATTYQAISGAGKTFKDWPEMEGNIIPYIGGEEEKSEQEPLRLWGTIEDGVIVKAQSPVITCQCVRVPVLNGHTAAVFVKFRKKVTKEQLIEKLKEFKGVPQELKLPSAPAQFIQYLEEDNRPQVTADVDFERGMGISVGRLREDGKRRGRRSRTLRRAFDGKGIYLVLHGEGAEKNMAIEKNSFGKMPDGTEVYKYTLTNKNGVSASFITLGGVWVSMVVPDKDGSMADVVLGYDDLDSYRRNPAHFGAPIGRNANRIGGAVITIDGKDYKLEANNGPNNLHSGPDLYHDRVWDCAASETEAGSRLDFYLESPDGDQGYPGNARITVSYTLTDEDSLVLDYHMVCDKDTVANFTNHSYFNLAGHDSGDVMKQEVWLNASRYTPADEVSIPTGEIAPVAGTPMDFTEMKAIGRDIGADFEALVFGKGYDHNWVLDKEEGELALAAKAMDPASGRVLECYTDLPGIQFYTANFLQDEMPGKGNARYDYRHAFCFETQYFPDAVHKPQFPSPLLKAGDEYRTRTVYQFLVKQA